jgi:hypothetical protein
MLLQRPYVCLAVFPEPVGCQRSYKSLEAFVDSLTGNTILVVNSRNPMCVAMTITGFSSPQPSF